MDASRFDRLVQRLARQPFSRRGALRLSASGVAVALGATGGVTAAQATPPAGSIKGRSKPSKLMADDNSTLFVQTASSGTFKQNPQAGAVAGKVPSASGTPTTAQHGTHVLTLAGHNGETIAFSDRPQRNFGEVKSTQFFQSMAFTPFNPPNAALVADTPQEQGAVYLVELMTPTYDAGTQTLAYEANLLHQYPNGSGSALAPIAAKAQNTTPAERFSNASLFIDDCPNGEWNCYTPASFVACIPVGTVTGGQCWSWYALACLACSDMDAACNNEWASSCNGSCFAKTMEEAEAQGC